MLQTIEISNHDFWFKVVEMLQQNWAVIEAGEEKSKFILYFIGDTSGVFDQMEFDNIAEAERQLHINGFEKYADNNEAQKFIKPPSPPFHKSGHPNGAIYSSGRYWKTK